MTAFEERVNGLRWRLRAMRRLWRPGIRPEMNFLPPLPVPEATDGRIDAPGAGVEIDEETMVVSGWVGFDDGPTARVEIFLDELPLGRARVGIPRPDLAAAKSLPNAGFAGFELIADLTLLPPGERYGRKSVRVAATGASGQRFEFAPIPIELTEGEPEVSEAVAPVPLGGERREGVPHTLVVTHQLTLGGAQLYLLDLLNGLRQRGPTDFTVVSSVDGPLREMLGEMGIPVHLTSAAAGDDVASHLGRVEELAAWMAPHEFDVALINTATTPAFTGAEAAGRLGIPAVWAIHESFPPALLWAELNEDVRQRAEAVVGEAAFAVFEAEATEQIFAPLIDAERSLTLPYGVDFGPIERARERFDTAAERRDRDLPEDANVLLCVGTVEPRKAQLPLAQAFELVASRHPNAHLVFVGGRKKDPHSQALQKYIESSPFGDRIELIPITPDVQPWYGLADVLVCASDIESLPRTVLEAMAWETPVLATSVFGLPDLIDDGETGWLCEPRDLMALAAGIDKVLSTPADERELIASRARRLVVARHSLSTYSEEIAKLLDEAAHSASSERKGRTASK